MPADCGLLSENNFFKSVIFANWNNNQLLKQISGVIGNDEYTVNQRVKRLRGLTKTGKSDIAKYCKTLVISVKFTYIINVEFLPPIML